MKISFTGTRLPLTTAQGIALVDFLESTIDSVEWAAHGCYRGSDYLFHRTIKIISSKVKIAGFPSNLIEFDLSELLNLDLRMPPKDPLKRNKDIVEFGSDLLIACPATEEEVQRSGTWACWRLAKKLGVPTTLILPSGKTVSDH